MNQELRKKQGNQKTAETAVLGGTNIVQDPGSSTSKSIIANQEFLSRAVEVRGVEPPRPLVDEPGPAPRHPHDEFILSHKMI